MFAIFHCSVTLLLSITCAGSRVCSLHATASIKLYSNMVFEAGRRCSETLELIVVDPLGVLCNQQRLRNKQVRRF